MKSIINNLLLFILWPFGSFWLAIKNLRSPDSKYLFIFFNVFLGLIFIPVEGSDSYYSVENFIELSSKNFSFLEFTKVIFSPDSKNADFFFPFLEYFISCFTNNPKVYFGIIGLVYGFFYTNLIWFVLNRVKGNLTLSMKLFFVAFALVFSSWYGINNCRFPIGSIIFYLGISSYILDNNKKGLIFAHLCFLVHFSLVFVLGVFWVYKFIGDKSRVLYILFIISFLLKELDLAQLQDSLSFLPKLYEERVNAYTDVEYATEIKLNNNNGNFYIVYLRFFMQYSLGIFISLIYLAKNYTIKKSTELYSLFNFILLLFSFSNIFSSVPSFSRMLFVCYLFALTVLILFLSKYSFHSKYKPIIYISSFFILLWVIVYIRMGLDYFGFLFFLGNPIIAFFIVDKVPIIEFIKILF